MAAPDCLRTRNRRLRHHVALADATEVGLAKSRATWRDEILGRAVSSRHSRNTDDEEAKAEHDVTGWGFHHRCGRPEVNVEPSEHVGDAANPNPDDAPARPDEQVAVKRHRRGIRQ